MKRLAGWLRTLTGRLSRAEVQRRIDDAYWRGLADGIREQTARSQYDDLRRRIEAGPYGRPAGSAGRLRLVRGGAA